MESHADPLTYSLQDIIDIMENIERQLKKIETIANDSYIKAAMSQCLVVVRKVGEDNLKKMDEILD